MVTAATSQSMTDKMRSTFATHGRLWSQIMARYSPCSGEFQEFMKKNATQHVTTSPYHPLSLSRKG